MNGSNKKGFKIKQSIDIFFYALLSVAWVWWGYWKHSCKIRVYNLCKGKSVSIIFVISLIIQIVLGGTFYFLVKIANMKNAGECEYA